MFTRLDERSTSAAVTWLQTSLRSAGAGLAASEAKRMRQEFAETEFTRRALHPAPAPPQLRTPATPQHPMPNTQCPMPTAHCPLPTARCPVSDARCPMPNGQWPMPIAQCPMPNAHYPLPRLREAVEVQQRWTEGRLAQRSSALPSRLRALCYEALQRYTQRCWNPKPKPNPTPKPKPTPTPNPY